MISLGTPATQEHESSSPFKSVIIYDRFQKEWRNLTVSIVGFIGLVTVLSGLSTRSRDAIVLGFLTIALSLFLSSFRLYLRIDTDSRTFESLKGLTWLQKPLKGSFDDFSSVEVGQRIVSSRYSSKTFFPVTVRWKSPAGYRFQIHDGNDFKESAWIAKELADKIGVSVRESPELAEFRNQYRHAAYEDSDE